MKRGLTLLELLVAATMTVFITLAVTAAYVQGIRYTKQSSDARALEGARIRFEDRIGSLLTLAELTSDTTDRFSYFIGQIGNGQSNSPAGNKNNTSDTLTFTVIGSRLPGAVLASTDDFETINKNFGPQGGVAEVSIEFTAVGTVPDNTSGIFLRLQRPADGDPTQGGTETVLDANVTELGFEFFDGTNWDPTWNTQTGTRRLPSAVRMTYRIEGDDTDRVVTYSLPMSDVTPDNPIPTGANG